MAAMMGSTLGDNDGLNAGRAMMDATLGDEDGLDDGRMRIV